MKRFFLFGVALISAVALYAQQPQALPNDPAVKVGRLENGLTYYIRHNDKPAQRCEFYLATNAGAINEAPGQDGLAHFLEHMCFNGLKNLPGKQMLEYLQSIGCSFGGNINAGTGVETTQYMLNNVPVIRDGIIDTCLLIMHDYSHFVLMEASEIESERGVILEEKRTRNTAQWRMFEQSAPYYYGGTKYATCNLIGSENTLKTFQREALVDFYTTWYRPDKQAVIVVGDIDPEQIEAKLKKLFADIPAAENPKQLEPMPIPDNEEPVIGVLTDPENSGNSVTFLWRRPSIPEIYNNTDQVFVLNIANDIFELVMDERFEEITSKPDAPFMYAGLGNGNLIESTDAMMGQVSFKNGQDVEAIKAFLTEVERIKRYGITPAEYQRAKDNLISRLEKAAQGASSRKNPEFIRPLIANFFDNQPYLEPQIKLDYAKLVCDQINEQIVSQMMASYITDKNLCVVLTGPSSVEHPTKEQILDLIKASRTEEVAAPKAEVANVALLDATLLKGSKIKKSKETVAGATEWTLANGVQVIFLPTEYKKDEVKVRLELQGGKSLIADEDLYSFEENILSLFKRNSGLAGFTKSELSKILAGKVASANFWLESTSHGISTSSTPKDLETALQLLYLTFTQPRMDADEYGIGINQIKSILPNLEKDPSFQLQKRVPKDVYGDTPRMFTISEEVVAKANIATYEKVYKQLFKDAAGAKVYVVGNVSAETLKPLVEKYIGSLPKGKKALSWKDDGVRARKGEYRDFFTTPMENPKASVVQIYTAYLPATVENKVLFSATKYIIDMVYTDVLREQEGGTYGASVIGDFTTRPYEGIDMEVIFDTNVDQAASLEALAKKGMKELAENGPSDEFFTRTVELFKNTFVQNRINNNYWMGVLNTYYEYGYNKDIESEKVVNELTKEKIAEFARKILEQGNLIEIEMKPEAAAK